MKKLDDFQSIHFWHEDIHKDQIHLFVLQETQALSPTFCGQDMVPCPFEHDLAEHSHLCFVINEQDSRHLSSHPFPASWQTTPLTACALVAKMGKGLLLAEWPGERTDDRPPQPKLLPVFGSILATTINPGMIEEYRATRRMEKACRVRRSK